MFLTRQEGGGEGLGVFGRPGTGGRLSVCDIKCQAET